MDSRRVLTKESTLTQALQEKRCTYSNEVKENFPVNFDVFESYESNVRSYCRSFPAVFHHAKDSLLHDEAGKAYIDFFAGAGALNYGHNNAFIKSQIIEYLAQDGVIHSLDMHTSAKGRFLETFARFMRDKNLDYKIMFCGPTGANAVEAAMKLARKIKQRSTIFSFMGGYHGLSLGSLAATSNSYHRGAAGISLSGVTFMPYPSRFHTEIDTLAYLEDVLSDPLSGVERPAAIIFETVQAEGGVIVAPIPWMQRLRAICDQYDILLICDDIQVGCGRTGPFFSFERAGIVPDMVTLSKSISGYGFPMSLLLMRSDNDIWSPAEHTGTFRGFQLAIVGATAALEYFTQENIPAQVQAKGQAIQRYVTEEILPLCPDIQVRGLGMIWGLDFSQVKRTAITRSIVACCFEHGLIIESTGREDSVLKILPPLTISHEQLIQGCQIIKEAITRSL